MSESATEIISESDQEYMSGAKAKVGSSSLFYFDKYILGYDKMEEQPHREMCEMVDNPKGKKKKLILEPRGTFKSSCVTIGYALQQIVNNPDIRILIDSNKFENSEKFLREIKTHIEGNEEFISCYGDLTSDKVWSATDIVIRTRTKNLKESTITVSSVDSPKVGGFRKLAPPQSQSPTISEEPSPGTI